MPFQFLLGCFFRHSLTWHFLYLLFFQFLLGCFRHGSGNRCVLRSPFNSFQDASSREWQYLMEGHPDTFNSFQDASLIRAVAIARGKTNFQFLLGCFGYSVLSLQQHTVTRLSIPSRMLQVEREGNQVTIEIPLSIPSRMLRAKKWSS